MLLAAFIIQVLTLSHGIGLGWLAPTLHNLQKANSTGPFVLTVEQSSWIGSLYGLGSLFGNIMFGILLNRLGRKQCLYLLAGPHMSAWILIYFSTSSAYLCSARFLAGVTGGGSYVVVPIFISEVAAPSQRGKLSSMAMLFLSVGILTGYILSSYLDYYVMPCVVIILPIIYLALATIFPETPQFLLRKQKVDKAYKSYDYYMSCRQDSGKNMEADHAAEFEELKNSILKNNTEVSLSLKDFVDPTFLKPFAFAMVLVFLNQFSGIFPFFSYMSTIFAHSGTDIDPNTCTIIMGMAQIAGTCLTLLVVDRFGRKIVMLISTGGMALGLFTFGSYVRFTSRETKLEFDWLPVILMIYIIIIGSIGILGLMFTIVVEILPIKMRSIGTSICMAVLSCMIFVALKIIPLILHDYGLDILFFSCGTVCIGSWFCILAFQKETKGLNINK